LEETQSWSKLGVKKHHQIKHHRVTVIVISDRVTVIVIDDRVTVIVIDLIAAMTSSDPTREEKIK
jgi:predicted lactoylglutathione lyase